ncbi:MAG: four helix bundle protein, partial [Bacteroidota bacterium]
MIAKLDDFKVYNMAMELGEEVWCVVAGWGYFEKDTMGKQLVRSVDSIAANLSEGLGRYHYKDAKNFGYYSRGSLFETRTWLTKSLSRGLITKDQFTSFDQRMETIGKMINSYIGSI